jgi:outer membrane protein assembly factor BamB
MVRIILTILFLFLKIFGQEIKIMPVVTIADEEKRAIDYLLVGSDPKFSPQIIIAFTKAHGTQFSCYNLNDEGSPGFTIPQSGFSRLNTFSHRSFLYIFMKKLYIINTKTFNMDSIELNREDYYSISIHVYSDDTVMVASSIKHIDIYSFPQINLRNSVGREEAIQFDLPLIANKQLVFRNRINELTIYDMDHMQILSRFDSGEQPAYLLGVKIGSFSDNISWYRSALINDRNLIYFTCFSGSIYCVDPVNGKIINQIYRFRGKENNAGLISSFELFDVSGDGVPDLIGASVDKNIYCIDGRSLDVIWQTDTGYENQIPLSYYDITGDSIPEVFGVNDAMVLTILSGNDGQILCQMSLANRIFQTGVSLVDLTGNGILNLIVKLDRCMIQIYQTDKIRVNNNNLIWLSPL